jgi:dipeptidyl aminopeptidase/acylaminoacyl peptidase
MPDWPIARVLAAVALAATLAACGERTDPASSERPALVPAADVRAAADYLLPRSLLFGDPRRAYGRLSPDGTTLAWLEPDGGVLNIWTAPVEDLGAAQVVTNAREVGVYQFDWLKNNTHIVYSLGRGGQEPQRVYSVDVITGEVRELTPGGPGVISRLEATSWDYPDDVVISANDRDPAAADLYRINVVTGERTLLFRNQEKFTRVYLDRSLTLTSASQDTPDGRRVLFTADPNSETGWRRRGQASEISAEDAPTTRMLGYDGTNSATYVIDSRGRDSAVLSRFDLLTGEVSVLAAVDGADVADVLLHPTTYEADAVLVDGLSFEWFPLTSRAASAFRILDQKLRDPYSVVSRTVDDRLWVILESGPTNPGAYHLFNRETGRVDRLLDIRPDIAAHRLAPMTPVLIKARDGLDLVSFLTLPPGADSDGDGRPETASPLVVIPDVGPGRRASLGYDPVHQWLADRGYAVLSVNVRGATGFGKAYREAGDGEIGGAVQDDLRDAVGWAVEQGVADPRHVGVFGFWLGGHAALFEAARPDTPFACAASYSAPMDLQALVEGGPPLWSSFASQLRQRLGDPSDPESRARMVERSPVAFADAISKPVLVGHGGLDGGDQYDLARATAQRAHDAGAPVTFVGLTQDAGDLQSPRNRQAFYAALEAFFAQCLGGRLEPIDADIHDAPLDAAIGAENVPVLAAALEAPAPEPAPTD